MDCERAAVVAAESLQDMASGLVYPLKPNNYDVRSERNSVQNSQDSNAGYVPEVGGDFEEVTHSASQTVLQSQARQTRARNRSSNANFISKTELSVATNNVNGEPTKMQKAFLSVHDMIHASIEAQGSLATLRGIYRHCQTNGRIVYKRSGGSRLITDNEHWKSQIRHALYTSGRFVRNSENSDLWEVEKSYKSVEPQVTMLPVAQSNAQNETLSGVDYSVNVNGKRENGVSQRGRSRGTRSRAASRAEHYEEHSVAVGETSNHDLTSVVKVSPPKRKRSERRQRASRPKVEKKAPVVPEATATTVPVGSTATNAAVVPNALSNTLPLEFWAQSIINSQQITQSINMVPSVAGQNPAMALQNAMSILTLLGSVVQSQSVSTAGYSHGEASAASTLQLEEEAISPVSVCKNLKPEQRMALFSILQQCDVKVLEAFQSALQSGDGEALVPISGMTKLMFRTFLNSLSMGLTISARGTTNGFETSGASEHHINHNLATANADTASSDAVWSKNHKKQVKKESPAAAGAVMASLPNNSVSNMQHHSIAANGLVHALPKDSSVMTTYPVNVRNGMAGNVSTCLSAANTPNCSSALGLKENDVLTRNSPETVVLEDSKKTKKAKTNL